MKISIVTAVRNGAETLGTCLESVGLQSVRPQHVIVDGASTDATMDVLRGWRGHPLEITSEPDAGLYDAMNKGIDRTSGDIVGLLHADDAYADPQVLARVEAAFRDPAVDACYGDLVYLERKAKDVAATGSPTLRIIRKWCTGEGTVRSFYWGWMPPHPTFFVRRSVYERCGRFRLDMGSAADYEYMLRVLVKCGIQAAYIPEVLVNMRVGGVSNAAWMNRVRANRMDRRAWIVNGLSPYPWTLWMKPLRKIGQWWVRGRDLNAGVMTNTQSARC